MSGELQSLDSLCIVSLFLFLSYLMVSLSLSLSLFLFLFLSFSFSFYFSLERIWCVFDLFLSPAAEEQGNDHIEHKSGKVVKQQLSASPSCIFKLISSYFLFLFCLFLPLSPAPVLCRCWEGQYFDSLSLGLNISVKVYSALYKRGRNIGDWV